MRHTVFARVLGIHPRSVRRAFVRGALPGALNHGERILVVPAFLLPLCASHGLRHMARLAQAGLLPFDAAREQALRTFDENAAAGGWGGRRISHVEFARALGISAAVVRRAYVRGLLPDTLEHSPGILMVPRPLLRLAMTYGLQWVGNAAKSGKIVSHSPPGRALPNVETIVTVAMHTRHMMSHLDFAEALGITPRLVRAQFRRGGLPGSIVKSPHRIMVPSYLFRLAAAYGLRRVERMTAAGILPLIR